MENAKADIMSSITATANSGKPWTHLISAHGNYRLKIN
jgi:hypothetical protein